MIEIYHGTPEDTDYQENTVEVNDRLTAYKQQVINVLTGKIGSIFGAQDMPVDLEMYIFDSGIDRNQLRKVILERIKLYCTLHKYFSTNINVQYKPGTNRQMAFIDIVINGNKGFSVYIR